jgi:hypothetical protein
MNIWKEFKNSILPWLLAGVVVAFLVAEQRRTTQARLDANARLADAVEQQGKALDDVRALLASQGYTLPPFRRAAVIHGLRVPVHLTSREALRILDVADIWAARTGREVRLVSANDHVHSRGSAHYLGRALDFHSSDPENLSAVFRQAGYRVLWNVPGHYSHVHVEQAESRGSASLLITPQRAALNQALKAGFKSASRPGTVEAGRPGAWRQQISNRTD